jgi:hypothetical protein
MAYQKINFGVRRIYICCDVEVGLLLVKVLDVDAGLGCEAV